MPIFKPMLLVAGAIAFALGALPADAAPRAQDRPWWEKSNCLGLEGVSWIECQKSISQNKRDRKAGRPVSNRPWWEESKCLGLKDAAWTTCQRGRSDAKRNPGAARDPWTQNHCLGLEGLSFVECIKDRKGRR
jgi:hypothetical protein